MSKTQQISTKFWSDTYTSNLDPTEKLLFIYFITNVYSNIAGAYELSLKVAAVETGIDLEMVQKVLARFAKDKKIYYVEGYVVVKNRNKYNKQDNDSIQAGVRKIIQTLPPNVKAIVESEDYEEEHPVPTVYPPSPKLNGIRSNTSLDLKPLNDNINIEGELKPLLDDLIAAYWEVNPVWCKNAGKLGSAREEFHQQLLKGYPVDVMLAAIQKATKGSKPWEIFKGSAWQKASILAGHLAPGDDWDEDVYFDKTLDSWVCTNADGLGMIRIVNEKYKPHKRGQPLVPDGGMYE